MGNNGLTEGWSKLMLGAVQFGMRYGIANQEGQPSYEKARDIIKFAHENGVNCLDTAAAYGDSEEVVGKALRELGLRGAMTVVSKVTHLPPGLSASEADETVEKSVAASLKRLGLDRLRLCLFHKDEDYAYIDALEKLRRKGMVEHVGVSLDDTASPAAAAMVGAGLVEAIQIPFNLFDSRPLRHGLLELAAAKGVAVFVRSVYLQGLLLMPEAGICPELREVVPARAGGSRRSRRGTAWSWTSWRCAMR